MQALALVLPSCPQLAPPKANPSSAAEPYVRACLPVFLCSLFLLPSELWHRDGRLLPDVRRRQLHLQVHPEMGVDTNKAFFWLVVQAATMAVIF